MTCHYCGCYDGFHYDECPIDTTSPLYPAWRLGYTAGRTGVLGIDEGAGPRATYRLGWIRGDIAADEASNGA